MEDVEQPAPQEGESLVAVFRGNGITAEMEAQAVCALLESCGIDSLLVRDNVPELPVGRIEVRVMASDAATAEEFLEQSRSAGPAAAEEAEAESEL